MSRWLWMLLLPLAAQDLAQDREAALGARIAADIRAAHKTVAHPAIQSYLEPLVTRLSATASVEVLAEDSCRPAHDPLLVPGGHLFVPAPLLLGVRNDAELAAALSHALAHDVHPRTPKGTTIPLVFMGNWQADCSAGRDVPLGFPEIQKENELKADARAVNPGHLLAWLERNPQSPELDRRIAALRTLTTAAAAPAEPSAGFLAMQEALRQATAPAPRRVPTLRKP